MLAELGFENSGDIGGEQLTMWRSWYERSPFAGKKLRLISRAGLSRMAGRAKERGAHE